MWLVSQRSRNIWTGVMKPYFRPKAQMRVPSRNRVRGTTSADEEAIRPYVTMPLWKAWPDDPRIVNAVMCVPNSENRNTNGPSERPARK